MKSIKFNSTVFNLVNDINVDTTRLQATVYKGDYSVEQIAASTRDCNLIQVLEDKKIVGQYSGYTKPLAVSMYFAGDDTTPIVSIELTNDDVISQIDQLNSRVTAQAAEVSNISTTVRDIDTVVQALTDTIGG